MTYPPGPIAGPTGYSESSDVVEELEREFSSPSAPETGISPSASPVAPATESLVPGGTSGGTTPVDEVLAEHRQEVEESRQQSIDAPAEEIMRTEQAEQEFSMRGRPIIEEASRRMELREQGRWRIRTLTEMFGQDALVLGHLLFEIPPMAIRVKKGNITYRWKPLRTKESIAVKSGNGEAYIEADLVFVGAKQIRESLAGLVTLWKKVPFCFIENAFIRNMMIPDAPEDSMAVCLENLIMDAYSGRPDSVFATLIMRWFNYKPFSQNFWFRRTWAPAGRSTAPQGATAIAASASTTPAETREPEDSRTSVAADDGAESSIVDLSIMQEPQSMRLAQPPEVRQEVSQTENPGDPDIAVTYPVVYPFNSEPFILRVTSGSDVARPVSSWGDGLTMKWRSFLRLNIPRSGASELPGARPNDVIPTRERMREVVPQPVEGERDTILIIGDQHTLGYLGVSDPGNWTPVEYNGTQFPTEDDFTYYYMARSGARSDTMATNLTTALQRPEFKVEGSVDGSRLAGAVILACTNDVIEGTGAWPNVRGMAQAVNGVGAIAVILTPLPFANSTLSEAIETRLATDCEQLLGLGTAAGGDRIVSLNTHEIMSKDSSSFVGDMKEEYRSGDPPNISINPNDDGYMDLAEWIAPRLPWGSMRGEEAPEVQWHVCAVEDGDTIHVHNGSEMRTIRLWGADTLETYGSFSNSELDEMMPNGQDSWRPAELRFGYLAKQRVESLIGMDQEDPTVTIEFRGTDHYGRQLGVISKGDVNINIAIIEAGLAFCSVSGQIEEYLPYIRAELKANGGEGSSPPGSRRGIWAAQAASLRAGVVPGEDSIPADMPALVSESISRIMRPDDYRAQFPPGDGGGHGDPPEDCPPE